jgi:hypothetical protein
VRLAEGLGVSKDHVFAIELNASPAARIAESYPDIRLLGPCSFEATRITRHSFSLVYLNPPFDDEFGGGGREEVKFVRQAVDLLVPAGILVLVCPVNQVYGSYEMCSLLDTWFDRIEVYLFPDDCRSFRECVVLGRRRKTALPDTQSYDDALWQELEQERFTTPLLRGWLPQIRKELETLNLLTRCYTLDCNCYVLTATSADLDAIVESGLKNRLIVIEHQVA